MMIIIALLVVKGVQLACELVVDRLILARAKKADNPILVKNDVHTKEH
jgi:hypothetical protein